MNKWREEIFKMYQLLSGLLLPLNQQKRKLHCKGNETKRNFQNNTAVGLKTTQRLHYFCDLLLPSKCFIRVGGSYS